MQYNDEKQRNNCTYILIEDKEMDLEMMIDDFVTFFIAGQETTANTLAFCFLELGRNKPVFNKYEIVYCIKAPFS